MIFYGSNSDIVGKCSLGEKPLMVLKVSLTFKVEVIQK
jgi:hypothetical protein